MQGQYVSGAFGRPTLHGQDASSTAATAASPDLDELLGELRGEVSRQWQLVRALRRQRRELTGRELDALRGARAVERRVRELERDVEARALAAGGGS